MSGTIFLRMTVLPLGISLSLSLALSYMLCSTFWRWEIYWISISSSVGKNTPEVEYLTQAHHRNKMISISGSGRPRKGESNFLLLTEYSKERPLGISQPARGGDKKKGWIKETLAQDKQTFMWETNFVVFNHLPISRMNYTFWTGVILSTGGVCFIPPPSILTGWWGGPGEVLGLAHYSSLAWTSSLSGTLWRDQGSRCILFIPALCVIMSPSQTLHSGVTDVISLGSSIACCPFFPEGPEAL